MLSYNIHKGFSVGNKSFVLNGIRTALRSVNADLVFLQEVLGEHTRHARRIKEWPSVSQFEFLADSLWPHHAYGKNAVYDEGHHGNAILSKYPIVEWSNHNISTNPFEQRGFLHTVIKLPGHGSTIHCVCVHLGLTGGGRRIQVGKITERIESAVPHHAPLVLAGDFNDWSIRATRVFESGLGAEEVFKRARGRHAATFPIGFPLLSLDRIYYRGLLPLDTRVLEGKPWSRLSDHLALWAEFGFLPSR